MRNYSNQILFRWWTTRFILSLGVKKRLLFTSPFWLWAKTAPMPYFQACAWRMKSPLLSWKLKIGAQVSRSINALTASVCEDSQHNCLSFLVFIDPRDIRDLINICSDRVVPNGVNFLPRNDYMSPREIISVLPNLHFWAFTFFFLFSWWNRSFPFRLQR